MSLSQQTHPATMSNNPHAIAIAQGTMRRSLHERKSPPASAFSISRVLSAVLAGRQPGGFESELIDVANENRGSGGQYMATTVLPWEYLQMASRDLTVAAPTGGGYLVGTAKPEFAVPFDGSVAEQVGVQIKTGQKENLAIPKTTATPTVTWLTLESSAGSEQTPVTALSSMSPKTACVLIDVSDRFLRQGALSDPYLNQLLLQAARSALDVAVFGGTGASGQPLGLINDTTIASQSGTAFNLATACTVQKTVADNVVNDEAARWVGATDVRQILQQRVAFASTASPLWADDRMVGRAARVSNRMPAAGLLYGDFTEVNAFLWGSGIEIAADPYTQFSSGVVTFRVLLTCDTSTPRPGALIRLPAVT
jgi:HK97 family phage major capsid protein